MPHRDANLIILGGRETRAALLKRERELLCLQGWNKDFRERPTFNHVLDLLITNDDFGRDRGRVVWNVRKNSLRKWDGFRGVKASSDATNGRGRVCGGQFGKDEVEPLSWNVFLKHDLGDDFGGAAIVGNDRLKVRAVWARLKGDGRHLHKLIRDFVVFLFGDSPSRPTADVDGSAIVVSGVETKHAGFRIDAFDVVEAVWCHEHSASVLCAVIHVGARSSINDTARQHKGTIVWVSNRTFALYPGGSIVVHGAVGARETLWQLLGEQ